MVPDDNGAWMFVYRVASLVREMAEIIRSYRNPGDDVLRRSENV
jgi:hypothetical protein